MSRNLPRLSTNSDALPEPYVGSAPPLWSEPDAPQEASASFLWLRAVAALKRYKWLMLAIVLAGTTLGLTITRFIAPRYEARATLVLPDDRPSYGSDRGGPIRGPETMSQSSWIELLKSYAILDQVVSQMHLYLTPADPRDAKSFDGFELAEDFRPGTYSLAVDPTGARYTLTSKEESDKLIESGQAGDSIGRRVGFKWAPAAGSLPAGRTMDFAVSSPRDASVQLAGQLEVALPKESNLLRLTLRGDEPKRTAATLNSWLHQFDSTAADLKRRRLVELSKILQEQLSFAKAQLNNAENAYASTRASTITLPSGPIGQSEGQDAYMSSYMGDRINFENARRDREALERVIADARRGAVGPDAIVALPGVMASDAATPLKTALTDLYTKRAQLAALRQLYTDDYKPVADLKSSINTTETKTIPDLAGQLLAQVRLREQELGRRVKQQAGEISKIPSRSVENLRLQRDVQINSQLYESLQSRLKEAQVAEESVVPDVAILDTAVAPIRPSNNTAPRILLVAVLGSLGAAVVLALLLDQLDKRFRYPEQATHELGLHILGAVPAIKRLRDGETDPDQAAQVIEAFRSLRLALRHAYTTPQVVLTVTSPGAGDGKSMISSNLALSFAEAGYRTVLVDGDIRRGELHSLFKVNQRPGLLDYLVGNATQEQILRISEHQNLTVVPCGARRQRGPELLASPAMSQLVSALKAKYDVIIVDSAPLGAGIDAYALGTATGSMLVVLRTGETDRKMAAAKLEQLDRFPVRVLGAVMNGIRAEGVYRYYSYLDGYASMEDDGMPRLAGQVGEVTERT